MNGKSTLDMLSVADFPPTGVPLSPLERLVAVFADDLIYLNRKPSTRRSYAETLGHFVWWCRHVGVPRGSPPPQ